MKLFQRDPTKLIRETPTHREFQQPICKSREHDFSTVFNIFEGPTCVMCTKCGSWIRPATGVGTPSLSQ